MKKLVSFAVAGTLLAALVGCNENSPVANNLSEAEAELKATPAATARTVSGLPQNDIMVLAVTEDGVIRDLKAPFARIIPANFSAIAVEGGSPSVPAYAVCENGHVWKHDRTTDTWERVYGAANVIDIANGGGKTFIVNNYGQVFVKEDTASEFVWHSNLSEQGVVGVVKRIDVNHNGIPSVVTEDGEVYYYIFDALWTCIGESPVYKGRDIGMANNGFAVSAWKYKVNDVPVPTLFWYGNNSGWAEFPEKGCEYLDFTEEQELWRITDDGDIFVYNMLTGNEYQMGLSIPNSRDIGARSGISQ